MRKLLGVFAHPDDESFTSAGTMAKYAKSGWQIDLVCATRGERGSRGPYSAPGEMELGNIRERELQDAGSHIGITSITFLDYKDGTLAKEVPGEIEDKLVSIFTELAPDIVLTFEPGGISNHPDHMKLTVAATFAFQKYAAERAEAKPDDPNRPKLYYACMPQSITSYLQKKGVIPEESFGKPWKGVEDKKVATVIDIQRMRSIKTKALKAHISQTEDVAKFFSLPNNPLLKQEYFILRMVGTTEAFMGNYDRISDRL